VIFFFVRTFAVAEFAGIAAFVLLLVNSVDWLARLNLAITFLARQFRRGYGIFLFRDAGVPFAVVVKAHGSLLRTRNGIVTS
jgi:hypothetical protein